MEYNLFKKKMFSIQLGVQYYLISVRKNFGKRKVSLDQCFRKEDQIFIAVFPFFLLLWPKEIGR